MRPPMGPAAETSKTTTEAPPGPMSILALVAAAAAGERDVTIPQHEGGRSPLVTELYRSVGSCVRIHELGISHARPWEDNQKL